MSGPENPTDQTQSTRAVLCAKCEHLNPHRLSVCETCGAHLYVSCHSCGHRNERVRTRCLECDHRLHRSTMGRWAKSFFGKTDRKMSHIQAALLIVAVLVGFAVIVWISRSTPLSGTPGLQP